MPEKFEKTSPETAPTPAEKGGRKEPPILHYDTFRPEKEIKEILKRPQEERPRALRRFKEKFTYQQAGLAEMQERLVRLIRSNPDIPIEKLSQEAVEFRNKYGFTYNQHLITKKVLEKYVDKHQAVREIRKEYPDQNELFQALFGRPPHGKIEVVEGPMTLYFRCHDLEDYALIYSEAFLAGRELIVEDMESADMSGGVSIGTSLAPGLEGAIIAEKAEGRPFSDPDAKRILIHEEEHAIQRLFEETRRRESALQELRKAGTDKERELLIKRYCRWLGEPAEERAKNEILAYFKSGDSAMDIFMNLTRINGLYDYNAEHREELPEFLAEEIGEEHRPLIEKAVRDVFSYEYSSLINRAIRAFATLREKLIIYGYSPQEAAEKAVLILNTKPLPKWERDIEIFLEQNKEKQK